jgi:hypothetical protein
MSPIDPPMRSTLAAVLIGTLIGGLGVSPALADGASPQPVRLDEGSAASVQKDKPARLVPRGWPNRRTTGAKGELRAVKGHVVTKDGTVLEDVEVRGTLTIRADNVTLRNVRVLADSYYGILVYGENTIIEHSTVRGTNLEVMAGISVEGSAHMTRIKVRGVEDGVRLGDDSSLRRSLVYNLRGDDDSHFDGVTADSYTGWRIIHNTILNPHGQTAAVWVGDARYGASEGVLRGNYLAGGGYTIYGGPGTGAGIRVTDNVFSTRYSPRSGQWGASTNWEPSNNVWSENTWADGPRKGRAVRP